MPSTGRTVSLIEASGFLNISRPTLTKWLHDGCPAVTKADKSRGIDWELSLGQIMQWRIDRAVEATTARFGGSDPSKVSTEEAKRRKAVADAVVAEIEADEALGNVVRVPDVVEAVTAEYAELRSQLNNLGAKIAGRAASMTNPAEIRDLIETEMRRALEAIRYDRQAA